MSERLAKKRSILSCISLACCLIIFNLPVYASYDVNKVRIFLKLNSPVDTLRVSNASGDNKPVSLQTRLMSWAQENGEDIYKPSNDLIVAPPMLRIPPNRTQLLRVGWRQPSPITIERAYRLYIQDISPFTPLEETGVQVKTRLGIPIFILPNNPIYRVNWAIENLAGNTLKVSANNVGNTHVQVIIAKLITPDGRTVGEYSGGTYIFPGKSRTLEFTMTDTSVKNLKLSVDTDSAPIQTNINIP